MNMNNDMKDMKYRLSNDGQRRGRITYVLPLVIDKGHKRQKVCLFGVICSFFCLTFLQSSILQQIQQRILEQEPNVSYTRLQYKTRLHRVLESPIPTIAITEVDAWKVFLALTWSTQSGESLFS
jgi:hypothetical protein